MKSLKTLRIAASAAIIATAVGCLPIAPPGGGGGSGSTPESVTGPTSPPSGGGGNPPPPAVWTRVAGSTSSTLMHVPSSAAGSQGIAIYVTYPAGASGRRYSEGAPVVVEVPGSSNPDTSSLPIGSPEFGQWGFISISMVFPGGQNSGGTFDYRGQLCARAVADVVRFATGQIAAKSDSTWQMKFVSELVSYPVLTNNVGIFAQSHGGNVAAIAMAVYGTEMIGVKWFAGWENPVSDKSVTLQTGSSYVGVPNPGYTGGYTFDYSKCYFSQNATAKIKDTIPNAAETKSLPGVVFFDANGNGKFDYYDSNFNGYFDDQLGGPDQSSDCPVFPYVGRLNGMLKAFYSVELTQLLESNSTIANAIWGIGNSAVATSAEAQQFFGTRIASFSGYSQQAVANLPGLAVIVISKSKDHAQLAYDYPHIKLQLDGWMNAGSPFVRLNPDSKYAEQLNYSASPLADNDANIVVPYDAMASKVEPTGNSDIPLWGAAAQELADRVHDNNWSVNLSTTLWK